jgi:hypothetical protein
MASTPATSTVDPFRQGGLLGAAVQGVVTVTGHMGHVADDTSVIVSRIGGLIVSRIGGVVVSRIGGLIVSRIGGVIVSRIGGVVVSRIGGVVVTGVVSPLCVMDPTGVVVGRVTTHPLVGVVGPRGDRVVPVHGGRCGLSDDDGDEQDETDSDCCESDPASVRVRHVVIPPPSPTRGIWIGSWA